MTNELVVDVTAQNESFHCFTRRQKPGGTPKRRKKHFFSVGNMYLGRVKEIDAGLNACFVDVGYEKDAFFIIWT